jgi:pimeloyl-ACP methyl ester carboxylesterase
VLDGSGPNVPALPRVSVPPCRIRVVEPFLIDVPQPVLDDLRRRLTDVRWPDAVADDWERGTRPSALRRLVGYWRDEFDWREVERRLNTLDQYRVHVDGVGLHVVRAGRAGATPLLLLHGWPDSFLRFLRLLPLLGDRFDLVVPSIPGFGFSDRPTAPGSDPSRVAGLFAGLMTELGFDRFGVHAGDVGGSIAELIAARFPERVSGLHLTDVPYWHLFAADPTTLTDAERDYRQRGLAWSQAEGAYASLQNTKPQTLAYALNDSPTGLAAWFLEKFRAWSDCGDDVFSRFDPDWLATNLTVYWVTQTAGSAARHYYESAHLDRTGMPDRVEVPTAVAIFPKDLVSAPREFAERGFDLRRWTEMPRGGHFAAWEEPDLLADDLTAFFDDLPVRG